MKKVIVLYGRRNVAMCVLSYLVAKGHTVFVISDDKDVLWLAKSLGLGQTNIEVLPHLEFDLFVCCHGDKIISKQYLVEGKMINIHPCLYKYKGHNPIKRYILNEDEWGTVESQWLIEQVDGGDVIHKENFFTGKVKDFASFYNIALPFYFKCLDETLKKIIG